MYHRASLKAGTVGTVGTPKAENVSVFIRVRPDDGNGTSCLQPRSAPVGVDADFDSHRRQFFSADRVFWQHDTHGANAATQTDIFNACGQTIVDGALMGFHGCIFAYGHTGAGKTYTIEGGPNGEEPGLVPRMWSRICTHAPHSVHIVMRYVEVYNERIKDLLVPPTQDTKGGLTLVQHPKAGLLIKDACAQVIKNEEQFRRIFAFAKKKRALASGSTNFVSSRSHTLMMIDIRGVGPLAKRSSRICVVDLAGSERAASVLAAESRGRLKEAFHLNTSLTTLGIIIARLGELKRTSRGSSNNHGGIPFRSSKLTLLLQEHLSANSKSRTFMIAAVHPRVDHIEDTLATLNFSANMRKVRTCPVENADKTDDLVATLKLELEDLRTRYRHTGLARDMQYVADHEAIIHQLDWKRFKEKAREFEDQRRHALLDHGLRMDDSDDKKAGEPFLVNICEDLSLSGALVYVVEMDTVVTLGSALENVIPMQGLGIEEHMAMMRNDSGVVSLIPAKGARIIVNGLWLDEPRVLLDGDYIAIGRCFIFRFVAPEEHWRTMPCKTFAEIQEELSLGTRVDQGIMNFVNGLQAKHGAEGARKVFMRLKELIPLIDEANDISTSFQREERFSVLATSNLSNYGETAELPDFAVRVKNPYHDERIWAQDKFIGRLELMRHAYYEEEIPAHELNPFIDLNVAEIAAAAEKHARAPNERHLRVSSTFLQRPSTSFTAQHADAACAISSDERAYYESKIIQLEEQFGTLHQRYVNLKHDVVSSSERHTAYAHLRPNSGTNTLIQPPLKWLLKKLDEPQPVSEDHTIDCSTEPTSSERNKSNAEDVQTHDDASKRGRVNTIAPPKATDSTTAVSPTLSLSRPIMPQSSPLGLPRSTARATGGVTLWQRGFCATSAPTAQRMQISKNMIRCGSPRSVRTSPVLITTPRVNLREQVLCDSALECDEDKRRNGCGDVARSTQHALFQLRWPSHERKQFVPLQRIPSAPLTWNSHTI